jgi:transposase
VGIDGFALLDALDQETTPRAARDVPMGDTLRHVWQTHFEGNPGGPPRWRDGAELPPVGERIQSPYDPQMHYSTKRALEWSGYKVHVTKPLMHDARTSSRTSRRARPWNLT